MVKTVVPIGHCCTARAQHLDMSRCWDVAKFCLLVVKLLPTCCRTVGVSSVGGVANMFIVHVVEFGIMEMYHIWTLCHFDLKWFIIGLQKCKTDAY